MIKVPYDEVKKQIRPRGIKDLTGQRFGRLVVLSLVPNKRSFRSTIWLCICDCGNSIEVRSQSLKQENTRSCGCLAKEWTKKLGASDLGGRKLARPGAAFRQIWRAYQFAAKDRGLDFKLSESEFMSLTQSPCFYCGSLPSKIREACSGEIFIFNGVDRQNSDIGYSLENCVPCCAWCNYSKKDLPVEEFIENCKRVAEFYYKVKEKVA